MPTMISVADKADYVAGELITAIDERCPDNDPQSLTEYSAATLARRLIRAAERVLQDSDNPELRDVGHRADDVARQLTAIIKD